MLVFIIFLIGFIYLPGRVLLHLVKQKLEPLIETTLSVSFGSILFTLVLVVRGFLAVSWSVLWIVPIVSLVYFIATIKQHTFIITKANFIAILLICFWSVLQCLTLFPGGTKTEQGTLIPAMHDTMWNVAIMQELTHAFPPQHPGFASVALKNNHFFYPLFLAGITHITHIDVMYLYYRLAPYLVALLFGLALYTTSSLFFNSTFWRNLTVFLGYFMGNAAYILVIFKGFAFDWKGNTFFADQPFDQLTNPYTVLGFVFVLVASFCIGQAILTKKSTVWFLLATLILGPLFGFKSFAGILGGIAFLVTLIIWAIKNRSFRSIIPAAVIFLILAIPTFLLISEPKNTSMNWAPGWILTQMMTDREKLYVAGFAQKEMFYQNSGNLFALVKLKTYALGIYLLGNLGVRMLGVFYLLRASFKVIKKRNFDEQRMLLLFGGIITVFGLALPLLFGLRGSPFNIIQFTPYALLFLVIPTVLFLKNKSFLFILIIVLLAIPVNIKNILEKLKGTTSTISETTIEATNYVRNNTAENAVILINPTDYQQEEPIAIAALSARRIYLADSGLAVQTLQDPKERQTQIEQIFNEGNIDVLKLTQVDYLYIQKNSISQILKEKLKDIKPLFENEAVLIFDVNVLSSTP